MSGSKLGNPADFHPVTVQSPTTRLDLPARAIHFCTNGIEFISSAPFKVWSEMTVALQTPMETKKLSCTGVVVACSGSRHTGYKVSLVFTNLSRQSQARLNALAYSR